MSKNAEIANIFEQMAAMLSILDDNPFKIRAYKKAALNILELNEDIEDRVSQDDVTDIPGVGKDLANKVKEYVGTGKIKEFDKLQEQVPLEMTELLGILGLGPKTLALLYRELHVRGLEDLEKVLDSDEVLKFKGLGQKKVDEIKRGIPLLKQKRDRTRLGIALPLAEAIKKEVEGIKGTEGTIIAGSIRRMRETIKDIDILTISDDTQRTVKEFTELPFVK
jgi:DNA polymerase (family 10)